MPLKEALAADLLEYRERVKDPRQPTYEQEVTRTGKRSKAKLGSVETQVRFCLNRIAKVASP